MEFTKKHFFHDSITITNSPEVKAENGSMAQTPDKPKWNIKGGILALVLCILTSLTVFYLLNGGFGGSITPANIKNNWKGSNIPIYYHEWAVRAFELTCDTTLYLVQSGNTVSKMDLTFTPRSYKVLSANDPWGATAHVAQQFIGQPITLNYPQTIRNVAIEGNLMTFDVWGGSVEVNPKLQLSGKASFSFISDSLTGGITAIDGKGYFCWEADRNKIVLYSEK
jgi:hypothetical protein